MRTYQPPQWDDARSTGRDGGDNPAHYGFGSRDADDYGDSDVESLPPFDDYQFEDDGWRAKLVQRERDRVQYVAQREEARDKAAAAELALQQKQ